MMLFKKTYLVLALIACSFTLIIIPSPGVLDTATFNPLGLGGAQPGTVLGPDSGATTQAFVTLIQGSQIIVAGRGPTTNAYFLMTRYNYDGSLDTSFGTSGIVTTTFPPENEGQALAGALQGNKIVLAGPSGRSITSIFSQTSVARYNDDGSLDTTFNPLGLGTGLPGTVTTLLGSTAPFSQDNNNANDVTVDILNNKIVIEGQLVLSGIISFLTLRYNNDGSLDTTFNPLGLGGVSPGIVITTIGTNSLGRGITLDNNKIVITGQVTIAGVTSAYIIRYNNDGSLDTTLNPLGLGGASPGTVKLSIGTSTQGNSILVKNTKILITGTATVAGQLRAFLARYNNDGSLDTTFNPLGLGGALPGTVITFVGTATTGIKIIDQASQILITGTATVSGQSRFFIARYNNDGSLDTTFNILGAGGTQPGTVTTAVTPPTSGSNSIALQGDKIVASGRATLSGQQYFATARYTSAPIVCSECAFCQ